jgi:hypothetical protein
VTNYCGTCETNTLHVSPQLLAGEDPSPNADGKWLYCRKCHSPNVRLRQTASRLERSWRTTSATDLGPE